MRSMTGFANQSATLSCDTLSPLETTISIKSLNSRFFEAQCRLPHTLSHLETDLIKQLRNKLIRGYVQCTIQLSDTSTLKGSIAPALPIIQSYLTAIDTIKKETHLSGNIEIKHILPLPNIFTTQDQQTSKDDIQRITHAVDICINILIGEQEKEGALIAKDLHTRIGIIKKEIIMIEQETTLLMERKKEDVNREIQQLQADENKLMEIAKSTVYLILDKIDIHEEITRFNSHLDNFITLITGQSIEIGKQLDFTLQELAREINTITAKCSDANISKRAIHIKVELEKAREQVQNII